VLRLESFDGDVTQFDLLVEPLLKNVDRVEL